MNLYLISQDSNAGYDTFNSAVVAAKSKLDARQIHPSEYVTHVKEGKWMGTYSGGKKIGQEYEAGNRGWVSCRDIERIEVEFLGKTIKSRGVVLASFNAG